MRRRWLSAALAVFWIVLCGTAQAQIALRGASSAIGPAGGAVTFRAATSAASGNITFRGAASAAGGAPAFVAAAFASAASGVLTISIGRPAGTLENDVMVASIGVSASFPTLIAPPGWTLVRKLSNAGPTANTLAVYYKVATANEPANYAWTLSASTGAVGGIQTFRGVDLTTPIDAENGQTTASALTHTAPSIATTVANTMLVSHHTFASSATWTPPPASGGDAAMTESFDVLVPPAGAAGQSLEGARVVHAAVGATAAKTATASANADAGNAHILALRPALRIPLPAGTSQNDVMIAAIAVQPNTAGITEPAGWTLVNRINNAGPTANSLAVYRKVATASEPSSYLWRITGAAFFLGGIQSFAGVNTATPIDAQGGTATASALTHTAPSIITTVANTMLVSHHTFASSATWTPPPASGGDAAMTESFDVLVPPAGAAGQSLEGARVVHAAVGATAAKTATASANADAGNAHILALRPSGTSIQIARPGTAVENDVMIAAIGVTPSSVTITPPAGWTLVRRTNNAGGVTNSLAVYQKVVSASEPTGYYWTFSAAASAIGGIQAFAGVDTSNPIDAENGQFTPSALTHTAPSITTTVANTMLVSHHTFSSSATWTPPAASGGDAAMTESFDVLFAPAGAAGQSLEGARVVHAAVGVTAAKTATASANADFGNAHILALRPEPGNVIIINTPPGTQANDVMVASIGFRPNTLALPTPAGWTLVRRVDNAAGTANSLAVYRRLATAAEPVAHTWTFSAVSTGAAGGIQSFSGVDTTTPVDVENGQATASSTSHATPSVATTVANTMIVTSHTFSSSATWTPPAGMLESFDRASLTVPNAAGQSIEGNRVEQGPIGATGAKTAVASANADTGNTHILALRPAPTVLAPGEFNAYETATPPGAITGVIKTKIAGGTISLDIVAINASRTGIFTGFTGTVRVEVVDSSSGGAPDLNGCVAAWPVVFTVSPDPTFVAGDNGRKTITFSVPNSYPNARIRVIFPAGATYATATAKGCSNDNFAIRPDTFANFSATDNDWQTAGTTRTLNNTAVPGGTVHKAGRPFTVRADAVNAAGIPAITTNYTGSPTATVSACGGSACTATFGALTLATAFAAGQLTDNTASYSEVGAFSLQLVDTAFAAVDAADSTPAERNITSPVINVGRFVPDHFAVSLSAPTFGTACGAGSFTYVGQSFGYTAQPVITVTAQNFANGTTALYDGVLWQITNASLSGKTYTAATGTLDVSGLPGTDPVIAVSGSGAGTLTFSSGTGLFFTRTTPVAAFDAEISLAINVFDADGVAATSNPVSFGTATPGNGIAFSSGKPMRFGRLILRNANGSQLVPLSVPMETHYWNGSAFITNTADSCTTIAASGAGSDVAMGSYTANLTPSPNCKTAISGGGALSSGRKTLLLAAPGSGNDGSVTLTVNLGAAASGNTCTAVGSAPVSATTANLLFLRGNWTGGAYTENPSARATFGVYKGSEEVIFIRENP